MKNDDNFVKIFKEVAYQFYNDIKKDKDNKIITCSSEFINIQVKNENKQKKSGWCS